MCMQSCCLANLNLLLFGHSSCRCHRRCLSSLLLSSKNSAIMVTLHHTSPLYRIFISTCSTRHQHWCATGPGDKRQIPDSAAMNGQLQSWPGHRAGFHIKLHHLDTFVIRTSGDDISSGTPSYAVNGATVVPVTFKQNCWLWRLIMNTSVKQEMYNEASILDNTVITVNWESRQKLV